MKIKVCTKCKHKFPASLNYFYKNYQKLTSRCKVCINNYRKKNKEKLNAYNKNYLLNNPDKAKKYQENSKERKKQNFKLWYQKNKNKQAIKHKKWRENNLERHRNNYKKWKKTHDRTSYHRDRRENIPTVKLIDNVRRRINIALQGKNKSSIEYLGIEIKLYKQYLENLFQPGMNWNNYGINGWHIDHIVPLSSAKNKKELIKLFHYTNTQPLWANDNLKKSNK